MLEFKNQKDVKLFSALHPIVMLIFLDLYNYAHEKHGVKLVITQTVSNKFIDKQLKRKSPAHCDHRAIDIRTKNLTPAVLRDILFYINHKEEYFKHHYLSLGGEKRLAYFHIGSAEHIHLAIHSRYKI